MKNLVKVILIVLAFFVGRYVEREKWREKERLEEVYRKYPFLRRK